MADVRLWGATYNNVPAITVPTSPSGTATFYEETGTLSVTENGTHSVQGYANVNVNVSGGGGTEFLVTFTQDGQGNWTPDKTFAETLSAYTNGKTICSVASDYIQTSIDYDDGSHGFYVSIGEYFNDFNGSLPYNWGIDYKGYSWTSEGFEEDETAKYYDVSLATALPSDVASAKIFYNTTGVQVGAMASGSVGTPTATKGAVSNHSLSVTPSVTSTTGYITGGSKTGTAVSVSASELVSGNLAISQNGNNIDVTNYQTVSVNVSGSSKNFQISNSNGRVATTSYTSTGVSLTVAKTGTYNVYWSGFRSSTSGTNGSQLYIGNTAYGTAQTTFTDYRQSVKLSNVSLTLNQTITVYARARGTSYYMCVSNLTIEEV